MDSGYDLITMAEILDLPSDQKAAFVEFERICRARMLSLVRELGENESDTDVRLEYMGRVKAAAQEFGIEGSKGLSIPVSANYNYDYYRNFLQAVTAITTQLQIRDARRVRIESVQLLETDKSKIQHHITQIRLRLDESDLDDAKKALIKKRLDALQAALNDKRLDLAKALVLIASVATIINQTESALIKLPEAISAIVQIVGIANEKEKNAVPQLEHKSTPLAIEAKTKVAGEIDGESFFAKSPDEDEIPF